MALEPVGALNSPSAELGTVELHARTAGTATRRIARFITGRSPASARTTVADGWFFGTSMSATRQAPKTLTARQAEFV